MDRIFGVFLHSMWLLLGLGNPGKKYSRTRHNAGHLMIEFLKGLDGFVLRKTSSFMNQSGRQVKKLLDEMNLPLDNLVVAHDDADLDLGSFKLHKGRGSAGHKGVESVIGALGTKDFWRLRIGIGRLSQDTKAEDYVLSHFTPSELKLLRQVVPEIKKSLEAL